MKHKKLRTVLITVVVIAALVAAYMIAFMRPQPLLDCLGGTEAPTTGTLTVYDQAHQEGQKWDVAEGSELDEVWQAMKSSQVRFLRGHGVVTLPDGGAYYEVKLANADGSSSYAFGCNSEGGSDHRRVRLRPGGRQFVAPGPGRPCPGCGGVSGGSFKKGKKNQRKFQKYS